MSAGVVCKCGTAIAERRAELGYRLCLECGDAVARERKWTVAHLNKSSFFVVTHPEQLKQLNPKKIGE